MRRADGGDAVGGAPRRARRRRARRRRTPRRTACTTAGVVVSSRLRPTVSASTGRRLMPAAARRGDDLGGAARHPHLQRVEPGVVDDARWPPSRSAGGERWTSGGGPARRCGASPSGPCHTAYMPAMLASSTCAVQMFDGRLLPADVLLTGLQGEAQRRPAGGVGADADQAPGQRPGVGVAGGQERGVRAAEAHRHAEALGRADDDVGALRDRAASAARRASRSVATTARPPPVVHRVDRRRQVGDRAASSRAG